MNNRDVIDELKAEAEKLRGRLETAEETIAAIRSRAVDALVTTEEGRERVYVLESADRPYRLLVEQMPEGALLLNESGTILFCNGRFAEIADYPAEEIVGRHLQEFVRPETAQACSDIVRRGRAENCSADLELRRRNGLAVPVSIAASPFNATSTVCAIVTDLRTKRHYEALLMSKVALRKTTERLERTLETEAVGVLFFDSNGTLIGSNDAFLKMTGYSRAEVRSRKLDWRMLTPPEWVRCSEKQWQNVADTGRIGPYEKELVCKDGSRRWMLLAGRDLGDGTVCEYCIDIADRKRAEEALREADRRKDEFLALLAHELRNPIAPIQYAAELLSQVSLKDPRVERSTAIIGRQIAHMARLIDDLLDVSRLSSGKIVLQKEALRLADVVQAAAENNEPQIAARKHQLSIEVASDVFVEGDEARLVQVVTNLIGNAAKFTPDGGRISITSMLRGGSVELLVEDTGIGIRNEAHGRIFELFTQENASLEQPRGGLGVGLALVKRLVEMHGGSVAVRSEGPGKGTTFIVRLPMLYSAKDRVDRCADETKPRGQRKVIVVIEDNRDSAEALRALLELNGHTAHVANDGRSGLRLIGEVNPDIALVDLALPGIDGFSIAREVRARHPKRPWLAALSGYGREQDKERARVAGFDQHLTKPISWNDIAVILSQDTKAESSAGMRGARPDNHREVEG